MPRFLRHLPILLAIASAILMGIALAGMNGWFDPEYPPDLFTVDESVKSFGEAPVGANPVLTFKFKNQWSQPVEIIGGNFG